MISYTQTLNLILFYDDNAAIRSMFEFFENYLPVVQKNAADFALMDARVAGAMAAHNLTYLQLLRALAVDCDQFVLFVRYFTVLYCSVLYCAPCPGTSRLARRWPRGPPSAGQSSAR